jgi:YfiH family protein
VTTGARHHGAGRPIVHARFTDRSDGDLCVALPPDELAARRREVAPLPWTWLDQVHGNRVVVVTRPGEHAGAAADAAVTAVAGATLAVHTADCAGVLLCNAPDEDVPVIGAAHAGWRGLESGVLAATVESMRSLGARRVRWWLGPCISPEAYAFGAEDLGRLAAVLGPEVVSTDRAGQPALDLRAGVVAALDAAGAEPGAANPSEVRCTAADPQLFSWRARRDAGRQAAVTWMEAT